MNDTQFFCCLGCAHAVLSSSHLFAVAVLNSNNILHLMAVDPYTAETFYFSGTNQSLDSTFCHIASLEVVRGLEQAFQINHSGFSLTNNATVEVYADELVFNNFPHNYC